MHSFPSSSTRSRPPLMAAPRTPRHPPSIAVTTTDSPTPPHLPLKFRRKAVPGAYSQFDDSSPISWSPNCPPYSRILRPSPSPPSLHRNIPSRMSRPHWPPLSSEPDLPSSPETSSSTSISSFHGIPSPKVLDFGFERYSSAYAHPSGRSYSRSRERSAGGTGIHSAGWRYKDMGSDDVSSFPKLPSLDPAVDEGYHFFGVPAVGHNIASPDRNGVDGPTLSDFDIEVDPSDEDSSSLSHLDDLEVDMHMDTPDDMDKGDNEAVSIASALLDLSRRPRISISSLPPSSPPPSSPSSPFIRRRKRLLSPSLPPSSQPSSPQYQHHSTPPTISRSPSPLGRQTNVYSMPFYSAANACSDSFPRSIPYKSNSKRSASSPSPAIRRSISETTSHEGYGTHVRTRPVGLIAPISPIDIGLPTDASTNQNVVKKPHSVTFQPRSLSHEPSSIPVSCHNYCHGPASDFKSPMGTTEFNYPASQTNNHAPNPSPLPLSLRSLLADPFAPTSHVATTRQEIPTVPSHLTPHLEEDPSGSSSFSNSGTSNVPGGQEFVGRVPLGMRTTNLNTTTERRAKSLLVDERDFKIPSRLGCKRVKTDPVSTTATRRKERDGEENVIEMCAPSNLSASIPPVTSVTSIIPIATLSASSETAFQPPRKKQKHTNGPEPSEPTLDSELSLTANETTHPFTSKLPSSPPSPALETTQLDSSPNLPGSSSYRRPTSIRHTSPNPAIQAELETSIEDERISQDISCCSSPDFPTPDKATQNPTSAPCIDPDSKFNGAKTAIPETVDADMGVLEMGSDDACNTSAINPCTTRGRDRAEDSECGDLNSVGEQLVSLDASEDGGQCAFGPKLDSESCLGELTPGTPCDSGESASSFALDDGQANIGESCAQQEPVPELSAEVDDGRPEVPEQLVHNQGPQPEDCTVAYVVAEEKRNDDKMDVDTVAEGAGAEGCELPSDEARHDDEDERVKEAEEIKKPSTQPRRRKQRVQVRANENGDEEDKEDRPPRIQSEGKPRGRSSKSSKPKAKRTSATQMRHETPSTTSPTDANPFDPELERDLRGALIQILALSRASSMPASTILRLFMQDQPHRSDEKSSKEWLKDLSTVLERNCSSGSERRVFGIVERLGTDAAGEALEPQWFYMPENDEDQERAAILKEMMPKKRTETRKHKQYYYRPVEKMSRWHPEDDDF